MATAPNLHVLNAQIFQQLGQPQSIQIAMDAINDFTRWKMSEDGITHKILSGPSIKWMLSYERWLAGHRYPHETAKDYWKSRNRVIREIRSGRRKLNDENIQTVHHALNVVLGALQTIERTYGFGMEVNHARGDDQLHA